MAAALESTKPAAVLDSVKGAVEVGLDSKKVAVVIPIYNVKAYLGECLESVLNQTYKNLEIILIDDGSNDGSSSIARDYFHRDRRVSLICKANGGLSSARNAGLEYLCGGLDLTLLSHIQGEGKDDRAPIYTFSATLRPSASSLAYSLPVYTDSISVGGGGGGSSENRSFFLSKGDAPLDKKNPLPLEPYDYSLNSFVILAAHFWILISIEKHLNV